MIKEKKSKAAEMKHEKSEGKMERMKEYGSANGKRSMEFCKMGKNK